MNETTGDGRRGKYSQELWDGVQTRTQWSNWLEHSWNAPSRQAAHKIIREFLQRKRKTRTFAEFGFGGAYDFRMCFQELHDCGKIHYAGWEVTPQFVEFAKQDFPRYEWRNGGLLDIAPNRYAITYSRHILQHVSPTVYDACLRAQLQATLEVSVLVWRYPPAEKEYIHLADPVSWQNVWGKERTHRIIEEEGFDIEIVEFDDPDGETIYVMQR